MRITAYITDKNTYAVDAYHKGCRATGIAKVHPDDESIKSSLVGFSIAEIRARIKIKKKRLAEKKRVIRELEGKLRMYEDAADTIENDIESLEEGLKMYLQTRDEFGIKLKKHMDDVEG